MGPHEGVGRNGHDRRPWCNLSSVNGDAVRALVPESSRRLIKRNRAKLLEAFGSERYSWPALNRLDRKLVQVLNGHVGTFLEIGANDGYSQSNTWYLERRLGWRGILIEPLPRLYRACLRARPRATVYNYACVPPDGPTTVTMVDRNLMSVTLGAQSAAEERARIDGHEKKLVRVPTATLSGLIDQSGFRSVDLISIDVEGAELGVLAGLDLRRHRPRWLLVETAHPDQVSEAVGAELKLVESLSHHDYLFEAR